MLRVFWTSLTKMGSDFKLGCCLPILHCSCFDCYRLGFSFIESHTYCNCEKLIKFLKPGDGLVSLFYSKKS